MGLQVELGTTTAVLIAVLFALSFFFSGTETALWSLQKLDRLDLSEKGAAGRMVDRLIARVRMAEAQVAAAKSTASGQQP